MNEPLKDSGRDVRGNCRGVPRGRSADEALQRAEARIIAIQQGGG
ncbi:hypothetical protein [Paenibacillus dendritiformis]|nr:hypothetical protein [Paenibacillus dendritiformis]